MILAAKHEDLLPHFLVEETFDKCPNCLEGGWRVNYQSDLHRLGIVILRKLERLTQHTAHRLRHFFDTESLHVKHTSQLVDLGLRDMAHCKHPVLQRSLVICVYECEKSFLRRHLEDVVGVGLTGHVEEYGVAVLVYSIVTPWVLLNHFR